MNWPGGSNRNPVFALAMIQAQCPCSASGNGIVRALLLDIPREFPIKKQFQNQVRTQLGGIAFEGSDNLSFNISLIRSVSPFFRSPTSSEGT